MLELSVYIILAIVVSFYCSLLESAFLSITPAFVQVYKGNHPRTGKSLEALKQDVDRPLAAILSLNTVAHTLGATGAGAQATVVFGSQWIGLFSALLTLAILILSEVIPKTLGALHWRSLTGFVAKSLPVLVVITYPLVWVSVRISMLLTRGKPKSVTREEIHALAELGEQEGAINADEARLMQSLLAFRDIKVASVMTPIDVVRTVDVSALVENTLEEDIPFSRIPVYHQTRQNITGYILKDDLHDAGMDNGGNHAVSAYTRPIVAIAADANLPDAIRYFSRSRGHIAVVTDTTDQNGVAQGIVTLEDVLETLIGFEIVDEFDPVVDMRDLAKSLSSRRRRKSD